MRLSFVLPAFFFASSPPSIPFNRQCAAGLESPAAVPRDITSAPGLALLKLAYYEMFLGVLAGLIVGSMIVYATLRSHFAGQVFGQAQRMASQMFESQKSHLGASIREAYEAKLGEWKATELAKAIEDNWTGRRERTCQIKEGLNAIGFAQF